MENFSTSLQQKVITLENASDVVRFSYFVHRSIFYLDLSMSQNTILSNSLRSRCTCAVRNFNYFVNTKEKCHMYFTTHRHLLHTLHLDVPTFKKCSLRNYYKNDIFESFSNVPQTIEFATGEFYCSIISNFIEDAIKMEKEKIKLLEWIVKINTSTSRLLYNLPIETVNKFIDCFYPTIKDHALFQNFILQINITDWIVTFENPEIVEFLLYHARHFRRRKLKVNFIVGEITDFCLFDDVLSNIGPFIKHMNFSFFPAYDRYGYLYEISSVRPSLTEEVVEIAEDCIGERRTLQILQLIWIWMCSQQNETNEKSSEALRIIWCSASDPFISSEEIRIFSSVFSDEELNDIYGFYSRVVGKISKNLEPRSLMHSCRLVIRRNLLQNNNWVPEAISRMNLPNKMKLFLNLEKEDTTNEECVK